LAWGEILVEQALPPSCEDGSQRSLEILVAKIKHGQRTSSNFKEAWWAYCDKHEKHCGVRDPSRHDAASIRFFLENCLDALGVGVPFVEEEAHGPELQLTRTHSGAECAICLATLGSCVETPCGHAFHAACLEHYFATSRQPGQRPRCPYCRSSVHAPLPVEARAVSGLPLEPVAAPRRGGRGHFDRQYRFLDLGDFGRAGMLYLLSSNEDRKTASSAVMWVVEARVPCTIHLNYRSARHVAEGRQEAWLRAKGFAPNGALRSAVSSGVPNGPYSGPVYSKVLSEPGSVELMGSATWEGTYFVFIDCS